MKMTLVDGTFVETTNLSGGKLVWDVSHYIGTKLPVVDELFTEINGYFASLDDDQQEEIWKLYQEIYEYIDIASRSDLIEERLKQLVKRVYDIVTWYSIYQWMRSNKRLRYPEGLRDSHDPNDKAPDKTYLRSEYWNLAVFAIWLRPMFPIWGEYLKLVESEVGTKTKEYIAFKIVGDTEITLSDPFERIERYIVSMSDFHAIEKADIVAITASLSSSELLPWMLHTAIIRRICGGLIDAVETGHLVSSIYGYINGLLNKIEDRFGKVKPKMKPASNGEDEKPIIDRVRPKQEQSVGNMAMPAVYLAKRGNVVVDICPDADDAIIERMINDKVQHTEMFQKLIAQYVLSLVMSPKILPSIVARRLPPDEVTGGGLYDRIVKNPVHDAIIITRVLLWQWGFPLLALLITGVRSNDDDIMATENSDRISAATVAELNKHYPHMIKKRLTNDRQRNLAYVNIMALVREIGQGAWIVDIPEGGHAAVADYLDAKNRLHVPSDIAEQLAKLAIHINQLQEKQSEI